MAKVLVQLAKKTVPQCVGLAVVVHPETEVRLKGGTTATQAKWFGVDPVLNVQQQKQGQHFDAAKALSVEQLNALEDIIDTLAAHRLEQMRAGDGFAFMEESEADALLEKGKPSE